MQNNNAIQMNKRGMANAACQASNNNGGERKKSPRISVKCVRTHFNHQKESLTEEEDTMGEEFQYDSQQYLQVGSPQFDGVISGGGGDGPHSPQQLQASYYRSSPHKNNLSPRVGNSVMFIQEEEGNSIMVKHSKVSEQKIADISINKYLSRKESSQQDDRLPTMSPEPTIENHSALDQD